ncbi:MAG TPA: PspC domain-containing protein [Solirubrobacteraceae bacterium]|nr:PspC domain-containing protein [Solirubrobacteraceae bacterium]
MTTTPDTPATPPPADQGPPTPRRFERSSSDRIIGGVCGGLGRYFGIDSMLVRIGFVALALLGGTGLIVYAAALLLVPSDGEVEATPRSDRDRMIVAGVAIVLVLVGFSLGLFGGLGFGGALFPVTFLALAGLAVYWFASGQRPSGGPRDVLRRAALGIGLIIACAALAVGSFVASGLGGGVVVAGLVVATGAALVGAAFVGGARWLVLPAMAIALPLAFVSAADIDLDGGFGERTERPATVQEIKEGYRIGAGELVIDLRDVKLPAGDHKLKVGVGTGHVLVLVDEDVCVATTASIGMGAVEVFDRDGGGIDVNWNDARRAPRGTPRLVVDGEVGLGFLEISHDDFDGDRGFHGRGVDFEPVPERNAACATSTASAAGSGASTG